MAVGWGVGVAAAVGVGSIIVAVGDGAVVAVGTSVATGTTCGVDVLMTTGVGVGDMVPTRVTLGSPSASQANVNRIINIPTMESKILASNMEPPCEQNLATCHSRRVPCVSLTRGRKSETLTKAYALILISHHSNPRLWHCQCIAKPNVCQGESFGSRRPSESRLRCPAQGHPLPDLSARQVLSHSWGSRSTEARDMDSGSRPE